MYYKCYSICFTDGKTKTEKFRNIKSVLEYVRVPFLSLTTINTASPKYALISNTLLKLDLPYMSEGDRSVFLNTL